jgi:[ribosomal protein S18]-alanine N-acetyltransferase
MDHDGLMIGEYEEGDLVEILAIERDSYPTPWSPNIFHGEMSNSLSRILVGRVEDSQEKVVAGYIVYWRVVDEFHLHNVAVRKDLRRRRIGSRLLSHAIRISRPEGVRWVTLEVRRSNRAAQNLYERFGLTVKGVRRGYYTDTGEDALIMSADLEQIPLEVLTPTGEQGARNDNIA